MSSTHLSLQPQVGRHGTLHGKYRRLVMVALTALLIIALVVTIRGVSANHGNELRGANTRNLQSVTTSKQGDSMDESNDTTGDKSASAISQSVTSNVTTSTKSNGETSTSITLNGKPIKVPKSGELHKTINDENGTTRLDISNDSDGNSTSSSVNVQVDSSSSGS